MLSKCDEMDCLWTEKQMQKVRAYKDSDNEKAWEAFGNVYQKYNEALYTLCRNVCRDDGSAIIVCGETWKKIWNKPIYDYQGYKTTFMVWVSEIAKRTWLDIKLKSVLRTDFENIPEIAVDAQEYEFEEDPDLPNINEDLLEEALHQLTDKEYDILMTYIEYDTDQKKHVPDRIIEELTTKYQTTPVNLRQIKSRSLKKVKAYIDKQR